MEVISFLKAHPFKIAFVALGIFFVFGVYREWPTQVQPQEEVRVSQVLLKNEGAFPDALTVPVGEFVQMNSADGKTHNIGYGHGDSETHEHEHIAEVLDTGDFGADEAYRVQIKEAGTFFFHDHYNPKIIITVVGYVPDSKDTDTTAR